MGEVKTMVLTVAYDGAPFAGFARQPNLSTVQGELEEALATLFRREVETTCAGRTDAGVHARGQQVSFAVTSEELEGRKADRLLRSLNALVADEIVIRDVRLEAEGFSARFDAKSREYRYRIACGDNPPLFTRDFVWHVRGVALDVDAMRAGARFLLGEHDFKSFCLAASAVDKPTHRNVFSIEVFEEEHLGENCLVVQVIGNAFLHSMVRTIVGTLVEVGCGRRESGWVAEVLAACDRKAAGPSAPAQGLTFWQVNY